MLGEHSPLLVTLVAWIGRALYERSRTWRAHVTAGPHFAPTDNAVRDRGVRLVHHVHADRGRLEGPREFHLITQDLATKAAVTSAVIAVAGANGTADVLSTAGTFGGSSPRPSDFVSRAVRAGRSMIEPLDPVEDWSFGGPAAVGHRLFAVSVPVRPFDSRPAALCAAVAGPRPGSDSKTMWLIEAYAQLASLWPSGSSGGRFHRPSPDRSTGCMSYHGLIHELNRELERCRQTDLDLCCAFVHLNLPANGHTRRFPAQIGRALIDTVGDRGRVGRYGGERFVLILPETRREDATLITEEVLAALAAVEQGLTASYGVAEWIPGTGAERLLGDADRASTTAPPQRSRKSKAAL
jgi:GGDEF domain-containing protein